MSTPKGRPLRDGPLGQFLRGLVGHLSSVNTRANDAAWTKRLASFVHRYAPEGPGPFPCAILLHGCGGDFQHLESWGRTLASQGILAFTIDSLGPRGLGPFAARCLVCTGLRLRGPERCRDITTILPFVLADPWVDRGLIHLVGWSHGAWTVTEWMLDAEAQAFAVANGISLASLVLVYPYCGIASSVHGRPWTSRSPVLVVTGEADRIVSNARTRGFIERLWRDGVPVTHVALDGVGHAFDVEANPAFDAAKAAELREIVVSFLRQVSC
jgi:dienelactone hydrolase